jgi:antitoxin (DNA-binding transcriptional repressor) of toxin-antitoxin stability system
MEIFTVEEFQENFDKLIERVENGEHIGIINSDGQAAVMIPVDDELNKLYIKNNNEGC